MNVWLQLETNRTNMCPLGANDAEHFYQLNQDPQVLKFTGDQPFDSIEAARSFLKNYDQYQKYGVGRLAVKDKSTHEFIGWCGLKYSPDAHEYDIGFRYFRRYWNKGYATETAQKCLDYGFDTLQIEEIVGRAMKDNIASIKVLRKLGMTFKETFDFDGQEGLIYRITKHDYTSKNR